MREAEALQPTPIIVDDTPQHVYIAQITMTLRRLGRCTFRDLFEPPWTRGRLVGLFLAVLEMVRTNKLHFEQPEKFDEIWVSLRDELPVN